jgi:hypothetical protein
MILVLLVDFQTRRTLLQWIVFCAGDKRGAKTGNASLDSRMGYRNVISNNMDGAIDDIRDSLVNE